jgi:transcriptional regulator with PAS, ATPase and Fis domain
MLQKEGITKLDTFHWAEEMEVQVTVCDRDTIIVYMNQASIRNFSKYGGEALLGKSLLDCHTSHSREKILEMLAEPQTATYAIPKDGYRKMIRQVPWMENGEHKGIIEIAFDLPPGM